MKLWLVSASLFTIGVLAGAQSDNSGVVHVDPDKVAAALAKGGSLVTRPDLLVSGGHREAAGQVEVHDKETDVLYVVDGEVRYTAVWRPSTKGEIQVYSWTYADYRAKYDVLWQYGWRLKLLEPYALW